MICFIFILFFQAVSGFSDEKELDADLKKTGSKKISFNLNTKETFQSVKYQDTYVFMVGNNLYSPNTDYSSLNQCLNDMKLLRAVFIRCLKFDPENIFFYQDLSLKEFLKKFKGFKQKLGPESRVIFTYSGHGAEDGSLVFVNGEKLRTEELKEIINSFENDTILIIDACYSGNNEGPKEFIKEELTEFKKNSIRIYASLAHLEAKEIQYNNLFFSYVMPFYKQVLGTGDIDGNGYFTAMIGLFFAEYKLKADENISFEKLVSYVTNKGKQYVEHLALRSKKSREATRAVEAILRLDQQPKILPIKEEVDFKNQNHKFILLQKPIRQSWPAGNFFSVGSSFFLNMPVGKTSDYFKAGYMPLVFFNYNFHFGFGILGLGLSGGANITSTVEDVGYQYDMTSIPLAFNTRFYTKLGIPLYIMADFNIGVSFSSIKYKEDYENTKDSKNTSLFISAALGPGYNITQGFSVCVYGQFLFMDFKDSSYLAIAPGISLILNF